MNRQILFVIDNLELKYFEFNKLVTNFWLIKQLIDDGNKVDITTKNLLSVEHSVAKTICYSSYSKNDDIFYDKSAKKCNINDYDVVFFRPDPPVDIDYINACYVFDFVDKDNVVLINDPVAVRNFNEKFHLNYFYDYAPKNIVSSSISDIKQFVFDSGKAIIKPLNRCFGSGVYVLEKNDKNLNSIINLVTNEGKTIAMVQEYLPEALNGDKRVLILGEKVYTQTLRKLPGNDDFKFNTHSDEFFKPCELTEYEYKMAKDVALKLNKMGLYMVGLDVVDGKILEINVTSPCYFINEINNFYDINFDEEIMSDLKQIMDRKSLCKI